jgi:parvulin-like peptidyl-prolyl isomerase
MSKKNADRQKEEEKDLAEDEEEHKSREDEEEEDDETEEDGEDEEEAGHAASASQPLRGAALASPVDARRTRGRARRDHDDDHGHDDHDDHGHEDEGEDDETDPDDPYWWTPHAVMSVLVLIGVLGFFGVFNKALGGLAAKRAGGAEKPADTAAAAAKAPPAQRDEFAARHLLVQWKGSLRAAPSITRTEEEAKARATEAMKKAKGGAKFEDIAKEYSDEPGASTSGGELRPWKRGQMVPEFQSAVEKLKVGEISDLVKTAFGYHVILRTQ